MRRLKTGGDEEMKSIHSEYLSSYTGKGLRLVQHKKQGYQLEVPSNFLQEIQELHGESDTDNIVATQPMKNTIRYKTYKMIMIEQAIQSALVDSIEREKQLFESLKEAVLENDDKIKKLAHTLSNFDIAAGNALLSHEKGYNRPNIVPDSDVFWVKKGRHITVEAMQQDSTFVDNDCNLTKKSRIWLITGANMGGKSTFLRQNALIAILAQAGCFVPAEECNIGVVDAVFSRVRTRN